MTSRSQFQGFPEGTFRFLSDIAANNNKAWFEANRKVYERCYLAPALKLVEALGPRLQEISKAVQFEARVNGSLFRIQRDIRFSKDKTPYKTHLDLWFWEGERRGWNTPSFFFRLPADGITLGAGMHQFGKDFLEPYRKAVVDQVTAPTLVSALEEVGRTGIYQIGGDTRKAGPRGYDPNHERAGLLLHDGLWAALECSIPPEVQSGDFVDYCAEHFRAMWPVNRWLLNLSP